MLANDMRKGTVVRLRDGAKATMLDNKKGMIRFAMVEDIVTEPGSIYVHDIAYVETDQGPVKLDFTPAQARQITSIKAAGF